MQRRAHLLPLITTTGALLLAACGPITLSTIFLRPTPEVIGSPADYGYAYDELYVPIDEDRAVSIWHTYAIDPKGVVVIIPGSDRNKSRYLIGLPVFVPNGYDVILMDYEGFGASTGGMLELERLSENGIAVVEYAQTKHENVIPFGISTGAATAVEAARRLDVAAVIIEAPLVIEHEVQWYLEEAGINDAGLWQLANLWVHPQIPSSFDILDNIRDVTEPKLIMQSTEDKVVPFIAGQTLYDVAPEPKEFFEMVGGHGEMVEVEPARYTTTIISWLDRTLGIAEPNAPVNVITL